MNAVALNPIDEFVMDVINRTVAELARLACLN